MSKKMIVNEHEYEIPSQDQYSTLVDVLRNVLHVKSVKRGCDYGGCGACTVIIDGKSVYSCMYPTLRASGKRVITLEGISNTRIGRALQNSFTDNHGYQCGYCTSGILLSTYELLSKNAVPSEDDIRETLAGNICRCTGYAHVMKSIKKVMTSDDIESPS